LEQARTQLAVHIPLEADGYVCTTEALWNLVLGTAANRSTLETVCSDLPQAPCAATVRGYLSAQLRVDELPGLERQINRALADEIPERVRRRAQDVAMDFHDQAYYGKTEQAQGLWVRAEAKDGTTRFYRVATAYMMVKHLRLTLAVCFVLPEDESAGVVSALLTRLKSLKIKVQTLYLDRGFASIPVIRCLRHWRQAAIIACPIRGKQGGTRALCIGHQSYRTRHTFRSQEHGAETVDLAVCRVFTTAKRTGHAPRHADWMVFIVLHVPRSPKQVRKQYRRRFGIESSYRCARQVRGWTTSNNPAYRFLLIALSFFLLNVWLRLRWWFAQIPRQRHRALRAAHFRLSRFAKFMLQALEDLYGYLHSIDALALQPIT
jgi:putative transposase